MAARTALPAPASLRLFEVIFALAVPLVLVLGVFWLGRPPEFTTASVIGSTVTSTDGELVGNVRWTSDDGVRHNRHVELNPQHVTSGTVPLVVEPNGELTLVDPSEYGRVPLPVLAWAAAIGLAFAFVVLATMRGLGFVRGTGRPGEMTPEELQESHAFYWRQ